MEDIIDDIGRIGVLGSLSSGLLHHGEMVMIPVYQTRAGFSNGNCFAACVASLLECPIEIVDFPMRSDASWLDEWQKGLSELGYCFLEYDWGKVHAIPEDALCIATGPSPRGALPEHRHSVVCRYHRRGNDCMLEYVHDPVKDGGFIKDNKVEYIGFLGLVNPAKVKCVNEAEAKDKKIAELLGHLETAWGVIANAGHPSLGDWDGMPEGWKEAAEKWRDDYHAILAKKGAGE